MSKFAVRLHFWCAIGARDLRGMSFASHLFHVSREVNYATHHDRSLISTGVLMALLGYAIGTYGGYAAALLCHWVS